MWSNQYLYYIIRSDAQYSRSLSTKDVIKFLERFQELKKNGHQSFVNQENFPWIHIACVHTLNGNFAHNDSDQTDNTNLITIAASKHDPENEYRYIELLKSIANRLNWELILEENDDGNKDIRLN